jgi:hypothetical protein
MREAERKESEKLLMTGIKQRKFKEDALMNSILQVHELLLFILRVMCMFIK